MVESLAKSICLRVLFYSGYSQQIEHSLGEVCYKKISTVRDDRVWGANWAASSAVPFGSESDSVHLVIQYTATMTYFLVCPGRVQVYRSRLYERDSTLQCRIWILQVYTVSSFASGNLNRIEYMLEYLFPFRSSGSVWLASLESCFVLGVQSWCGRDNSLQLDVWSIVASKLVVIRLHFLSSYDRGFHLEWRNYSFFVVVLVVFDTFVQLTKDSVF